MVSTSRELVLMKSISTLPQILGLVPIVEKKLLLLLSIQRKRGRGGSYLKQNVVP